jgi:RND family efflux transporter MFP subunit
MSANVDLRQLAVRREETTPPASRWPRHLLTRYVLPGAVVLGFLGLVGWAARDSLAPARPVTVVPVLTTRSEVQQEGSPLFQAAGWVEPRPTPVLVAALAEGVVESLLVVEGQEVKAGDPVARLVDTDARLALKTAEVDLRLRRAEADGACAALKAVRTAFEKPVQLRAALAEAEATLSQKESDLAAVPFQRRTAQARLDLARLDYEGKEKLALKGSVSEIDLRRAKGELEAATAAAEELDSRGTRLGREVEALKGKRDALRQRLELKTDEARQLAEAEAQAATAAVRVEQAEVALEAARLRLERMTVRAPVAGRVLALLAPPGTRAMGMAPVSMQDASTVVSLYDPQMLQVRADVRLEDVPRVQPGQAVKIETAAAPGGPLDGEVLLPTSRADIQKNTLQVKVAVKAPPGTLRPEMLVRLTFLAPRTERPPESAAEALRLLVPRALVDGGEGGSRVWVADQAAGVARLRAVKLGAAAGELVEVVEGLNAADRLISGGRDGLREGQRVAVTGEDTTGLTATRGAGPGKAAGEGGHQGKH